MSNTYQPILLNKITDDIVIEILNVLIPIFHKMDIQYFVVGAFARDIELLAKGFDEPPSRITQDVDLAVMMSSEKDYEQLKTSIADIDGFELHKEPIKIIYKGQYEIDLLPFGDIENEKGIVELSAQKVFTLDMPGFAQIFPTTNSIKTSQGYDLKVCPLHGIVLLKLIAWNDRKQRIKDIQDIEYIIRNLYLLEIENIVAESDDILDLFKDQKNFTELVTARYIGRKIGKLTSDPKLKNRVLQILEDNTQDVENSSMAKLLSFDTLEESVHIIRQIHLGILEIK